MLRAAPLHQGYNVITYIIMRNVFNASETVAVQWFLFLFDDKSLLRNVPVSILYTWNDCYQRRWRRQRWGLHRCVRANSDSLSKRNRPINYWKRGPSEIEISLWRIYGLHPTHLFTVLEHKSPPSIIFVSFGTIDIWVLRPLSCEMVGSTAMKAIFLAIKVLGS